MTRARLRAARAFGGATSLTLGMLVAAPALFAASPPGIQRLQEEFGPRVEVSVNPATGVARFLRLAPGEEPRSLTGPVAGVREKSDQFLARHARAFGIADPATDLVVTRSWVDQQGGTHLDHAQYYRGVPVFGARLKTHFDAQGRLRVVNGTTVPDIDLDVTPRLDAEAAGPIAIRTASAGRDAGVSVRGALLMVYRAGLARGERGLDHLVWRVEVANGRDIREFVHVDAHTGKVVERISAIHSALIRKAFQGDENFPQAPFWTEGDALPTSSAAADDVIAGSGEIYHLFLDTFGRDSYDGAGGTMNNVFEAAMPPGAAAYYDGLKAAFGAGFTSDDIVGHEWMHGYTSFTHDLVYMFQPGALNEAYSSAFGEVVDFINGRGIDSPAPVRSENLCSSVVSPYGTFPTLRINSPAAIAGDQPVGVAQFGPRLVAPGITADLVLANDGIGSGTPPDASTTDGCCAGPSFVCAPGEWTNAAEVAGRIAVVDRGTCLFPVKVKNAQLQGAIGVVVLNHVVGGDSFFTMFGSDDTITVPAVMVGFSTGNAIKSQLSSPGVNATLRSNAPGYEASYRWILNDDGANPFDDLWSPTCASKPGKVSDPEYACVEWEDDAGGVHTNSGVPAHAFALLVDGGTYNGQTVRALGLVKTTHLYFRAMTVYQGPFTDFPDHADALDQSCQDLLGVELTALGGGPSGEVFEPDDCHQVGNAAQAVELRRPITPCGFLLAKDPPDRCEAGTTQANVLADDFESSPLGRWTVAHSSPSPTFTPHDWEWVHELPDREGSAMFAIDPLLGLCDASSDESGVLHLFSPVVTLPPGAAHPRLTFDHSVGTEPDWDGGNLKVSVNHGPWQLVAPSDYTYNPYNRTLFPPEEGNTNPIAGEPAFSGTDPGQVNGSWGRSHVNLSPYAAPGDAVQLRFDMGRDGCFGFSGWYLDDPTLYDCVPSTAPNITIGDVEVTEGHTGFASAVFTVNLSHASAEPVSVWYLTWPGTAWPFLDFVPVLAELTIPPLHLEGRITVKIVGDRAREKDETFFVKLLAPDGGTLVDDAGRGTIRDDDSRR